MSVAVLMPIFGDASELRPTLEGVAARAGELGGVTVFLVDDGSPVAIERADVPRCGGFRVVLARHVVNLGQGAALETARALALAEPAFDAYVTMDADGQHLAEDLVRVARAIEAGADVVFGNRFLGDSNVPAGRRALLHAARWFERAITGLRLADAHNGLRGFSRRALERLAIRQNRMAHATEITQRVSRAARELVIVEIPVSVRYSRATLARGQSAAGAFAIVHDLFDRYLFGEPE